MKGKHVHGQNGYHSREVMIIGSGPHLQLICVNDGIIYREVRIKKEEDN